MNATRKAALAFLIAVYAASVFAGILAPASYDRQFRDEPNAAPSRQFPLGSDDLGRDRLSRLLYGSRVSLLLAPGAALLSVFLAAFLGAAAGFAGGWAERIAMSGTDLFLSLPWLFLLLTVRAVLPLNTSPVASVIITFALLALLGWAGPARVVCAAVRSFRASDFVLQATAGGCRKLRLLAVHVLPNLKPILIAQFWVAVPVFILAEANLGLLGLGVAEPLPSLGNLLRGLENLSAVREHPVMLAPVVLLALVLGSLHLAFPQEEYSR